MIDFNIKVKTGGLDVLSNVAAAIGSKEKNCAFREATEDCVKALYDRSRDVVPYDTWALHDSAKMVKSSSTTNLETWRISYNKYYAIYQHEVLYYKHKPGRKAKYLSWVARDMAMEFLSIIVNNIRQTIRRFRK